MEVWYVLPRAMFTVVNIKGHLFDWQKSSYIKGLYCNGMYLNYPRICPAFSED